MFAFLLTVNKHFAHSMYLTPFKLKMTKWFCWAMFWKNIVFLLKIENFLLKIFVYGMPKSLIGKRSKGDFGKVKVKLSPFVVIKMPATEWKTVTLICSHLPFNKHLINDFAHVRYNCNLCRNSVRYRGPIVWNLIPTAIRDASSQQLFKQKLRQASRILDQIQFEKEACQITSKQTGFLYF